MIGTWGSAAVRYELARSRSGNRTLRDTLKEETMRREAKVPKTGVRLPSNLDTFNPYTVSHNVLAWCLLRRGELSERERRFLFSAFLAWGTLGNDRLENRKARQVIALLSLYEEWMSAGSRMLPRCERLRSLNPNDMNMSHVRRLSVWVQQRLRRVGWIESSYFDPELGDFQIR